MKIAICGNYGVFNAGDDAILEGLTGAIKKHLPEAEIVVMGKGRLFPFGVRSFAKAIFRPSHWMTPYRLIKSCDAFVIGGGGLFTPEERGFVPIFWAMHGIAALLLKKPVYCLGISVYPLKGLSKILVKFLFSKCKYISVRDKDSYRIVAHDWEIPCKFGSDFAMLIDYEKSMQGEKEKQRYIVISMRSFKGNNGNLYKILAQACDKIIEDYGLQIKLVPFQKGDQFDAHVLNKIFAQAKHKEQIFVENFYADIKQLIKILERAELVIAMRLHAGILSLLAGTMVIPLSYTEKVKSFWGGMKDIDFLEIPSLTFHNFMAVFHKTWNNRSNLLISMQNIKDELTKRASKSIETFIGFLKK